MRLQFRTVVVPFLWISPFYGCSTSGASSDLSLVLKEGNTTRDPLSIQPGPSDEKDSKMYCPSTGYDYYNDMTRSNIHTKQSGYQNKILIQFSLDAVSSNAAATSAVFQLYMGNFYDPNGLTIACCRIMVPWVEGTGNWTIANEGANWYSSNVMCTLTGSDTLSGPAGIYYSLDGAPANTYSSPFVISTPGIHTLLYYGMENAGNTENHHSVEIKIDNDMPATRHTISSTIGPYVWYISEITLYLNASDEISGIVGVFYSVNNGTYGHYTQPLKFSEGIYYIKFYAKDVAGNKNPERNLLLKVDTSSPAVSHFLPEPTEKNGWHVGIVVFELNASDEFSGVAAIYFSIDCGVTINISGKIGKNGRFVSAATVKLEAHDPVSWLEKLYCRINGGSYSEYTTSLTFKNDGKYNITVYASDSTDNKARARSFYLKIDTISIVAFYYLIGKSEWKNIEMVKEGTEYTTTISKDEVKSDGIDYYILAEEKVGFIMASVSRS